MQEELRQRAASFDSTSPMSPRERELLQELSQLRRINNNNINNDNNSVGSIVHTPRIQADKEMEEVNALQRKAAERKSRCGVGVASEEDATSMCL